MCLLYILTLYAEVIITVSYWENMNTDEQLLLTTNQSQPELERNRVLIRDEENRFQAEYKRRINEFNTHLSLIVKNELVDRSKLAGGNASWFFKIVFPDIPELTDVELVVPVSFRKWPHYNYDEIVEYIKARYPEITSPSFNVHSFRLQINVDGQHLEQEPTLQDPKNNSTELPKVATVELRYKPLREPVPSIEEILKAGAAGSAPVPVPVQVPVQVPVAGAAIPKHLLGVSDDNWDDGQWNEEWDGPAAPPPPPAPAPRLPNTSHPPPFRDPVSGLLMVYDPVAGFYHTGYAPPTPPPPILPNGGNQTGNYGGKKPKSKRGKKKSKSKSNTKKSKSKSKRNKRRSYKRVK